MPRPGRKAIQDEGRLRRMAERLVVGVAKTPWEAAGYAVEEDPGDYPSNTRRRIYDKYRPRAAELEAEVRRVRRDEAAALAQGAERVLPIQRAMLEGLRGLVATVEELARLQGLNPLTTKILVVELLRQEVRRLYLFGVVPED